MCAFLWIYVCVCVCMYTHVYTQYNLLSPFSFLASNCWLLLNEGVRPPSTTSLSVAETFVLSEPPYPLPLLHTLPAVDSHSLYVFSGSPYPTVPSQVRYWNSHSPEAAISQRLTETGSWVSRFPHCVVESPVSMFSDDPAAGLGSSQATFGLHFLFCHIFSLAPTPSFWQSCSKNKPLPLNLHLRVSFRKIKRKKPSILTYLLHDKVLSWGGGIFIYHTGVVLKSWSEAH